METKKQQLAMDYVIPGQTAFYWIKPEGNEPTEVVNLSPAAIEYLAEPVLRASLQDQLYGDSKWAVFPVVNNDDTFSHTIIVPRSPLKFEV